MCDTGEADSKIHVKVLSVKSCQKLLKKNKVGRFALLAVKMGQFIELTHMSCTFGIYVILYSEERGAYCMEWVGKAL